MAKFLQLRRPMLVTYVGVSHRAQHRRDIRGQEPQARWHQFVSLDEIDALPNTELVREQLARLNARSAKPRIAMTVSLTFNVVAFLVLAFVFSQPCFEPVARSQQLDGASSSGNYGVATRVSDRLR